MVVLKNAAVATQGARQAESPDAAMHQAFALAAQYITLAYALQPTKEVYRKSLRVRAISCTVAQCIYLNR